MKRLITLMLMLLAPVLASATDSPCMQGCNLPITAGSMTIVSGCCGYGADFNVTGPGGSATGHWDGIFGPSFGNATQITSGEPLNISWGEDSEGFFFMSATVDGFSLASGSGLGQGPEAFGHFQGSSFMPITGPGTYKGTLEIDEASVKEPLNYRPF